MDAAQLKIWLSSTTFPPGMLTPHDAWYFTARQRYDFSNNTFQDESIESILLVAAANCSTPETLENEVDECPASVVAVLKQHPPIIMLGGRGLPGANIFVIQISGNVPVFRNGTGKTRSGWLRAPCRQPGRTTLYDDIAFFVFLLYVSNLLRLENIASLQYGSFRRLISIYVTMVEVHVR